jgi:hypothetical protein
VSTKLSYDCKFLNNLQLFEVSTAMLLSMPLFWDKIPHHQVTGTQLFDAICCINLHDQTSTCHVFRSVFYVNIKIFQLVSHILRNKKPQFKAALRRYLKHLFFCHCVYSCKLYMVYEIFMRLCIVNILYSLHILYVYDLFHNLLPFWHISGPMKRMTT